MPTGEDLANVASSLTFQKLTGIMCHDAVAECLVKAAIVSPAEVLALKQRFPRDPCELWTKVYANTDDRRVTRGSVDAYGYGLIVGFYPPGLSRIYHSMIAVGGGVLAGYNNLGVGGSLNYQLISVDDLLWNDAGTNVGINDYQMHVIGVDEFLRRYGRAVKEHMLWKIGGSKLTIR